MEGSTTCVESVSVDVISEERPMLVVMVVQREN